MKLLSVGSRLLPVYRSEDGRVEIHRYGSLPSMWRWVAYVDGERAPGRTRTRRDAIAAAESKLAL